MFTGILTNLHWNVSVKSKTSSVNMKLTDISNLRLTNQHIEGLKFKTAKEIVGWMGAMQAQDFNMSKWAIGVRLPGATEKQIESAIGSGEIIRTHLLRPTWHYVSSDDIYWMLELTAPRIRSFIKSRDKELGLTEKIFRKSNAIIEKALTGRNHLSREELITEFVRADIATDKNRASHLLLRAELDGLICSGKLKANKPAYTLLQEWVPKKKSLKRDEALAELTRKYFKSHCPATLQDFAWWSGLSVTESKQALDMIKSDFASDTIGNQIYWFDNTFSTSGPGMNLIYFLPAYDEFIISYKDRSVSLQFKDQVKAVSNNGIFRPVIVVEGQVTGIWKRTIKKEAVILETEFFNHPGNSIQNLIEEALIPFGHFLDKKVEVV
jgi:hypothetical protein